MIDFLKNKVEVGDEVVFISTSGGKELRKGVIRKLHGETRLAVESEREQTLKWWYQIYKI